MGFSVSLCVLCSVRMCIYIYIYIYMCVCVCVSVSVSVCEGVVAKAAKGTRTGAFCGAVGCGGVVAASIQGPSDL